MQKTLPSAGPLCTRSSLASDLRSLGVASSSILLVHSSLSSLGFVCGGAEAVVLALLEVLGEKGTLVVPTHSSDNSDPTLWQHPPVPSEWWSEIRASMPAYNQRTTRTRLMGAISETVRTWPGVLRSAHPQTSFAAIGPQASGIVDGHALDCLLGGRSPLARLEERDAKVLLLGVGWDVCTAFHLAEYRSPSPTMENNSFAVMTNEGREWKTVGDVAVNGDDFGEMGESFEKVGPVLRGRVGRAAAKLFSVADAVRYAESWLPLHRPHKTNTSG